VFLMDLLSLDHVHFSVPDLERAQALFAPFLGGAFTPVYGGPELNAWGVWNSSGGDFLQVIRPDEPVFGGSAITGEGLLSVSFRVEDLDVGIAQAEAAGLRVRSRTGSEEAGFGKNVVQAQLAPDESFGLGLELVERQIPGDPHVPMTEHVIDHVEHLVSDLEAPTAFFSDLFGSPFEPAWTDPVSGARSARHPRFGIQLTTEAPSGGSAARRVDAVDPEPHAIAFQSRDLERDVAIAEGLGLKQAHRRVLRRGASEVSEVAFEPDAGVVFKLVGRRR
jgi:catechol 2,3-dioxygenase-like lactoylglutathione lyase family enzyme